jgi:hypothetical protein
MADLNCETGKQIYETRLIKTIRQNQETDLDCEFLPAYLDPREPAIRENFPEVRCIDRSVPELPGECGVGHARCFEEDI